MQKGAREGPLSAVGRNSRGYFAIGADLPPFQA